MLFVSSANGLLFNMLDYGSFRSGKYLYKVPSNDLKGSNFESICDAAWGKPDYYRSPKQIL